MPTTYGFADLQHLYNTRVLEVGPQRIYDAIRASNEEYNRVVTAMLSLFVRRTTVALEQIELPGDGTLQPLSEHGNPLPVLPSGSYQAGYPIQGAGTAWGDDRVTRALMTVEEADRATADAQRRDMDWLRRHILAALFDNVAWTYNDKVGPNNSRGFGNITVQPLANNDTVPYMRRGGALATDNHYLAQAAGISDAANPFPALRAELIEHPSNSGPFVAFLASNLVPSATALTEFVEADDPDIRYGADNDTLAVGNRADILGPGDEVLGKTRSSNMWLTEWSALPSDYMIVVALGADTPVLRMREYAAAELQGLFPERADVDGNHMVTRMIRYCGFGVANRVGAAVMRIGNAAYAIPSGFDAPLPV